MRVIRQNVSLSLGVKAVLVGLTISDNAALWSAIAADMGVSLFAIARALRLPSLSNPPGRPSLDMRRDRPSKIRMCG